MVSRVHAAADPGRPGAAGLRRLAEHLADPGGARRRTQRRGGPGLGTARLPAAGAAAARRGGRDRRASTAARCPTAYDALRALPGVGDYTAAAIASFAFGRRTPCWTPTCAACSARAGPRRGVPGRVGHPRRARARRGAVPEDGPPQRWAVAVMELGALVCTAAAPRCGRCPVADLCAWRLAGSPAYDGPPRRGQTYAGTDRQCRGRLLAVLRDADGPVPGSRLDGRGPTPRSAEAPSPARRRPASSRPPGATRCPDRPIRGTASREVGTDPPRWSGSAGCQRQVELQRP